MEYDWTPPRCSNCCLFGHKEEECKACVSNEKQNVVINDTVNPKSGENGSINEKVMDGA